MKLTSTLYTCDVLVIHPTDGAFHKETFVLLSSWSSRGHVVVCRQNQVMAFDYFAEAGLNHHIWIWAWEKCFMFLSATLLNENDSVCTRMWTRHPRDYLSEKTVIQHWWVSLLNCRTMPREAVLTKQKSNSEWCFELHCKIALFMSIKKQKGLFILLGNGYVWCSTCVWQEVFNRGCS